MDCSDTELFNALKMMENLIKDSDLSHEKDALGKILQEMEQDNAAMNHSEILLFLSTTADKLKSALSSRQKQYQADFEIVKRINNDIDTFRRAQSSNMESFIGKLNEAIISEIESYKTEIIEKLNPHKINMFSTKTEFEYWLQSVNENYLAILNRKIEKHVQDFLKIYLWEIEKVLINASNYLKQRPNYLDFENEAYGTLSKSKAAIVKWTRNQMIQYGQYNGTFTEAANNFFKGVSHAKKVYDYKVRATARTGGVYTGLLASQLGASIMTAIGVSSMAIPAAVTVGLVALWLSYDFLKDKSGKFFEDKLIKEFEKHRSKFETEVGVIQQNICLEIGGKVTFVFNNELSEMEKAFMQYRMTVNIDSDKLPLLESELIRIEDFLKSNHSIPIK